MDELDRKIIAALRKDARLSISSLSKTLDVARATVQHRITRLENDGIITGYTATISPGKGANLVRAIMAIETTSNTAQSVVQKLRESPNVAAVHSTNGRWDLIAELQADSLEEFDKTINSIRQLKEISASETNLLLSTYKF